MKTNFLQTKIVWNQTELRRQIALGSVCRRHRR